MLITGLAHISMATANNATITAFPPSTNAPIMPLHINYHPEVKVTYRRKISAISPMPRTRTIILIPVPRISVDIPGTCCMAPNIMAIT